MPAAEQRYESFADIDKLAAEKGKIVEMFREVKSGIQELRDLGITLNTSKSVKEVARLTEEVEKQEKELTKQQQTLIKMANNLAALTTEEAKQIEALKQVTSIQKGLNAEEIKTQKLQAGAYAELQRQKIANNELNKSIQLRVKIAAAEKGSETQLLLLRQKATGILQKLSQAQRDSSRGQALQKYTKDLNDQINVIQQKVGNFKNNVGNYAQSLVGGFELVRREIARLQTEAKKLDDNNDPAGASKVRKSIEDLDRVVKISYNSNQSYGKTVKQIERAYQDLATSGQQSNEFLQEFKKFAAESKDQAADLRDEIKALSSDTRGLDLAVGSITALASGFEAVSGVMALTGNQSEAVEKSIQRLVAIQSVANGIRDVGEQITKRGTAANKAYNFVLQQGTILFGKGSTAAQRFGAALKGVVILAVIGFLISAIKYLVDFDDKAEDAKASLEKLNNEIERNKELLASLAESDSFDFKSRLEDLKRAGAERLKLAKDEADKAKIEAANKKEQFDAEVKFKEETIRKLRVQQENANDDEIREAQRQNEYMRQLRAQGITEISKERAEAMKGAIKATEEQNKAARKALADAQRDLILFKKAEGTTLAEEDAKQFEERMKKAKELAKAERDAAFELFKYRQTLIKDQNDFIAGEDGIAGKDAKIKAAKIASDAEIAILNATREHELSEENIAASKRILINEEADNKIYDARIALSHKITEIRVKDLQRIQSDADASIQAYFDEQKAKLEAETEFQQKSFEKEQARFSNEKNQAIVRVTERYKAELEAAGTNQQKRAEAEQRFNNYKEKIEIEYQKSILNSQIIFYEQQLKLLKDSGQDTTEALRQLNEAKAALATLGVDSTKGELEALEALKTKYAELRQTVTDAFVTGIGGVYEAQKRRIDEQIDKISELKAAEIDRINASTDSEEKKAAKIKIVEAQAQARKEQLERRQRQIDRQKAIFDRGAKVFDIITDNITAVNKIKVAAAAAVNPVIKALLISQIPLTIATGAAGLIALLATPLPKYWTGTESSEGGPAHVAERGRELGIEPSGNIKLWKKPTIANLVKGTRILRNEVTEKVLAAASSNLSVDERGTLIERPVHDDRTGEVVDQLAKLNKKFPIHIHNEAGIETSAWYKLNMKY
jgi:hypothetical protein